MTRSIAQFWSLLSRVEEWFFIAHCRFVVWLYEGTGMEEDLLNAVKDFLQKDKDDDAAAALVTEKDDAVHAAMDDAENARTNKQQTADAKAAARKRVEDLMDATN